MLVSRVSAVLPGCGEPAWLAPDVAADLPFALPAGSNNAAWTEAVRATLCGAPVDAVVQSAEGRRKRLLIADMDSTLIEQECIDELADAVGLRAEVSAITKRSMRGEIDFESSLRERVALLRGLDVAAAMKVATERIVMTQGARRLVATMRGHGSTTAIASGGFTLFTGFVAQALGFERHYANTLVVEDGRLTGTLREPILGRDAKREILRAMRMERGLEAVETLAVGDGANDLAMLAEAGLGVAFRAKPKVAAAAEARIDHGDLTALLYLQGYTAAEFLA